jgi:hypothetical protein
MRLKVIQTSISHANFSLYHPNMLWHIATRGRGYRRCHAMERLVVLHPRPLPVRVVPWLRRTTAGNAIAGACPHAPCHCPGETCGFVGSVRSRAPEPLRLRGTQLALHHQGQGRQDVQRPPPRRLQLLPHIVDANQGDTRHNPRLFLLNN